MGHQGTQPPLSLREPKVRGNLGIGHNYSIDNFFSFLFLVVVLWFVDCFASLAMTKGKRGGEFFFFFIKEETSSSCGLLRFTRNDSTHKLVIARVRRTCGNLIYFRLVIAKAALPTQSLQEPTHTRHCEGLKSPWQSRYGNNHTQSTSVIARTEGSWQSQYGYNYSFI